MFEKNTPRAIVARYKKACRKVRKQWPLLQEEPVAPTGLSLPEFLAWYDNTKPLRAANDRRRRVIARHAKVAFNIENRYRDVGF